MKTQKTWDEWWEKVIKNYDADILAPYLAAIKSLCRAAWTARQAEVDGLRAEVKRLRKKSFTILDGGKE